MAAWKRAWNKVGSDASGSALGLEVRLLGPLTIRRQGVELALPASRKARALIGYLSLASQAMPRSQLCELLWDVPERSARRTAMVPEQAARHPRRAQYPRLESRGDSIRLDLANCFVDAVEISQRDANRRSGRYPPARLRELCTLFNGELLDGLEVDRNPGFNSWLTSQRRRFRSCHTALLEQLAKTASGDEVFVYLEQLAELAPFDQRVHEMLLNAFARRGRIREGEEHLAATARLFEAEGSGLCTDSKLWRAAKAHREVATDAAVTAAARVSPRPRGQPASASRPRRASIAVMPFASARQSPALWATAVPPAAWPTM